MCFSAEVSFGAAAVLGAAGTISLKKASHPGQYLFASIPLLFAVQQVCEGLLWLSLSHTALVAWQRVFTYAFLFFAQALWTTWLPLSFYVMENSRQHKKWLLAPLIAGVICSLLLGYRLLTHPVSAEIDCRHIYYEIASPHLLDVMSSVLYVVAILLPSFLSSHRYMLWLGILLTLSLVISKVFYENYLISVWCFFAAMLSGLIVYIIRQFKYQHDQNSIENFNRKASRHAH